MFQISHIYQKVIFIIFLLSYSFNLKAQQVRSANPDTTILTENCLKKTIIKEGYSTSTYIEILNCFWETGTDTSIVIENCEKKIIVQKMGHKKITSHILACYWDDATKQVDTFLVPKNNNKWALKYITYYTKPSGEIKTLKSTIGITSSDAYRAGLDTIARQEYDHSHRVFKQYGLIKRNHGNPIVVRDTTINNQAVLKRVNQIRADYCQCGDKKMNPTSNLKWSDKLAYVAYLHAKDMFERDYFSHISPEGEDPGNRIKKSELKNIYWGGENIAEGQIDGSNAVESWKESPGHCENMMGSSHTHVGVARYMDKYVMLLGSEK